MAPADECRFVLPAGNVAVLVDPYSLSTVVPPAQMADGVAHPLPALLEAYRTGRGVPCAPYREDLHEGQVRFTRPLFVHQFAEEWLPLMPAVHARLGQPGARVANVGIGQGFSRIAFARGYPTRRADGMRRQLPPPGSTPRRRA